jgi:hypothetical protein
MLTISARPARHPVYRTRAVFWGEVHDGSKLLYGIGPFRKKAEAEAAALLWANQRALPGIGAGDSPLLTRLDEAKAAPQKPCDVGLFSDAAKQVDLLDLL